MMPLAPVYVISKGRYDVCYTARFLVRDKVPFRLVVEPQEEHLYREKFGDVVTVLPFSNLGLGGIPARNWVWEHAKASGAAAHWILDDNIRRMKRRWNARKVPCEAGVALRMCEVFSERYENLAISGPNYDMFSINKKTEPAVRFNCHVYSCLLIRNDLPFRWRGRYNEDTDLCLQALARGLCTVQFNAFLAVKMPTMTMKGGNAEIYQGDGRLAMARSLERAWPGVVKVDRRWGRPQHVVDWGKFRTPLRLKPGVEIQEGSDEHGMRLVEVSEPKSAAIRAMVRAAPAAPTAHSSVLDGNQEALLEEALATCEAEGQEGASQLKPVAHEAQRFTARGEDGGPLAALLARWDASCVRGEPDFGVYQDALYTVELWACWGVYSRPALRALRKATTKAGPGVLDTIGPVRRVVDLGCGIGTTTAALAQLFPEAEVIGTNIQGTLQARVAERLGAKYRFRMAYSYEEVGPVDLVLASEFFEHVPRPVEELESVLRRLRPRAMLVANAFGTKAIGHLTSYRVGEADLDAQDAKRRWSDALKRTHHRVPTSFWNQRPALWMLNPDGP